MVRSHIWYVSYGSNLLSERFATYLEGGTPQGRTTAQQGARDPSRWTDDRPLLIPHRLFFTGDAKVWGGGGVAFVDPHGGKPETRSRAYRITAEQFQDVLAQESGRPVGHEVDMEQAVASGTAQLGDGRYDLVIHLGQLEGESMFTFTTPRSPSIMEPNPPSEAYRATIVQGLVQCHTELDTTAAEAYIDERSSEHRR
jgi:hypothetical protein